ncbi:MAG: BrnT family toxin [Candidatus Devosia phytovorans]|uniref:BrnT family toxin n=1 Tax=Candidatus Devosia phytovorans TaxID=3121372 RepID=A0AAJ6B2C6_9HYPH|nr:BrnT family toxin [Devosia sp.]WEK05423.1 MAG: BrnT family toxin [Devosia sp.]
MRIVYDEIKRQTNLAKHGLDMADIDEEFFFSATIEPAKKGRSLAIGRFNGILVVAVIFRPLGSEALSLISMRPASDNERRRFDG